MDVVDLINEKLKELEDNSVKCNPHTASIALGLGRLIEIGFWEKEIDEEKMTEAFDKADELVTRFRHDCECSKK